jgi:O-acetyl-ADP-ribose deacetylase (regulator of RNase III)
MPIEYVKGNLFDTHCNVIVHGCNAQGVMGSGVAKIIRDQYPEAYQTYKRSKLSLGSVSKASSNGKIIVNAITQQYYGRDAIRYVSYDAISEVFVQINHSFKNQEIAMPQIGAGLGGGDWSVISAIIESELKCVTPYVYIL